MRNIISEIKNSLGGNNNGLETSEEKKNSFLKIEYITVIVIQSCPPLCDPMDCSP